MLLMFHLFFQLLSILLHLLGTIEVNFDIFFRLFFLPNQTNLYYLFSFLKIRKVLFYHILYYIFFVKF